MKKFLKLLFITLLIVPVTVLADMGAPMIKPFEAVITKKGGITVTTYDKKTKKIEENEKVKVTGYNENYEIIIGNDSYEVAKEDAKYISPINKEVGINVEGVKKLEKTREFEVRVDNTPVYKGPAEVYEQAGHLNKGDQITAFYYAEVEDSFPDYFYIQEENLKGWIHITDATENDSVFWETNSKPLKVIFTKDTTLNGISISANSIYKIYYWASPYLSTSPVIKVNNEMVKPENDTYEIIADSKTKTYMFKMEQYNFVLKKDKKLYTTYDLKDEITTIPAKTELSTINLMYDYEFQEDQTYYIYVAYNNKLGWIKVKGTEVDLTENNYDSEELISPFIDPEGDDGDDTVETTEAAVEENKDNKEKKKVYTKETVIIAVIAAISLSIMSISAIVMLNKKNKKDTLKDINDELEKTQPIKSKNNEETKEEK